MTRKEITGQRDLTFSEWIRENLPNSFSGFCVTDVDFFLYNFKTKKIMILEIKTRNKEMAKWQNIFYKNIDEWLRVGVPQDWTYRGAYLIKFENTFFNDGKCWLTSFKEDKTLQVTERALKKFLSL